MCRSLAGVHSRAITETLAICGRGSASRPRGKSAVQSASSRTARHSVTPTTRPRTSARARRGRDRGGPSRRAQPRAASANSSRCAACPVIACASRRAELGDGPRHDACRERRMAAAHGTALPDRHAEERTAAVGREARRGRGLADRAHRGGGEAARGPGGAERPACCSARWTGRSATTGLATARGATSRAPTSPTGTPRRCGGPMCSSRRGRLSDPEERTLDPPDLAPADRSGPGAHLRVLPRLRAVEDTGEVGRAVRIWGTALGRSWRNSCGFKASMWRSRWPTIPAAPCGSAALVSTHSA